MTKKVKAVKSKKLAQFVVDALDDLKGESIRTLNVEKLTAITDYMVKLLIEEENVK